MQVRMYEEIALKVYKISLSVQFIRIKWK